MSVAVPPLPQYTFMAWCLVKAQGQPYLYLFTKIFVPHPEYKKKLSEMLSYFMRKLNGGEYENVC
jgi:hypothetical protein